MSAHRPKFVFITGGVVSSLGKGLAGASLGALMESRGLKVAMCKLDPYLNVDPGTMNPIQHGEVYVTEDGAETDLDLGHYERFTHAELTARSNITAGQIYQRVIDRERRGDYLGSTVQVIPHVTDEIKQVIAAAAHGHDLCICEIGGTVGDIESLPFLEAIRQFGDDAGATNALFVHLTWVPCIRTAGEVKTKPTQHSVKELRAIGISPDILLCRCEAPLDAQVRAKISLFSSVSREAVFSAVDVPCIYQLPVELHHQGLDAHVAERLNIWARAPTLDHWREIVERAARPARQVTIAVVGKYVELVDAYKSLHEALMHGGLAHRAQVNLRVLDSEQLVGIDPGGEGGPLAGCDAVLVPGGFGSRGIAGKLTAVEWARRRRVPFLGICLGMQVAVIEYARHLAGLERATSREFDPKSDSCVIDLMAEQKAVTHKGGTMRLGAYRCRLLPGTLAQRLYGADEVSERHRHRFEVNSAFRGRLEAAGLTVSGTSPDDLLVEMVELKGHPFFVACQFHPEFKSKPFAPHPLFVGLVAACLDLQAAAGAEASSTSAAGAGATHG